MLSKGVPLVLSAAKAALVGLKLSCWYPLVLELGEDVWQAGVDIVLPYLISKLLLFESDAVETLLDVRRACIIPV